MNDLSPLIAPRSIAILGASEDPERIGGRPVAALLRCGFSGPVYPVNPKRKTVQGLKCYETVGDIEGDIDCAVIALPADAACQAAQECADRGVRSLVIFSAGFAELGEEGAQRQRFLTQLARTTGMRIIGPNCIGMFNSNANAYQTFTGVLQDIKPTNGGMALISQSGGYGSSVLKLAAARNLHFGVWITTGNECDLEVGELMESLAVRPDVSAIVTYLEGARSGPSFLRGLASAREHGKPVIVMKVGRTAAGASAVASHTASIAGEDWVYEAILNQYGAYRAKTTEELIDVSIALNMRRPVTGRRLGVITTSGGIGAQIADLASESGLEMPDVPAGVQQQIRALAPHAATANPVDVTGQVINDPAVLANCMALMLESGEFDAIYVYLGLIAGSETLGKALHQTLHDVRQRFPQSFIMISLIADEKVIRTYEASGFLVTEDPSRAVRSLAGLVRLSESRVATPSVEPAKADVAPRHRSALAHARRFNEVDAKAIFADYGIPAPREVLVQSAEQVVDVAGPSAVKVVSADIQHKTDIGGVALGLVDRAAVAQAVTRMSASIASQAPDARIDGYLVSPMIAGGVECFLGIHQDPVFGPAILFGLGGVSVEIFKDVVCRMAPVALPEAMAMVREIRAFALLDGHRGKPKADVDALAQAIVAMSNFALDNAGCLVTAEINPLIVLPQGQGVLALDAVLETQAPDGGTAPH